MITKNVEWGKQPATRQKARRLAWHSRRRETHRQGLRRVDCGGREMGAKRDGPGIAWSCLERENSKVVLTSDMAEKCQSTESLFHRPVFWMKPTGLRPENRSACESLSFAECPCTIEGS